MAEREADGTVTAVFAGGGTGGHLYPALALADALAELRPDVRPFFLGAERGIEARVLPEKGRDHALLPVRGVARGVSLWRNLGVAPALVRSLWQARRLFGRLRPRLVVVTGGYAGFPAGFLTVARRIPLALQEQNAVPGLTTRLLSPRAKQIHVAFPEAAERLPERARPCVLHSGNPIQPPREIDEAASRERFGLAPEGPVLLVVGGSQGSAALNRLVVDAVRAVESGGLGRPEGLQVLWSTGPRHLETVQAALDGRVPGWVRALEYIDDMPSALGVADLALSRAGAMATSEFLAWGVPMVLVPLPTAAADHQTHNARTLEEAGAAVHLPEAGLEGPRMWRAVVDLAGDPERLERAREAARGRARPDAAHRIAAALAELLPPPAGAGAAHGGTGPETAR